MIHDQANAVKDVLVPWTPIPGLTSPMYIEAVYDDYEGRRILLRGEDPTCAMLRVAFDNCLSYRNTDESYLLKLWHSNEKEVAGKIFYTIENSSYIDFFHEMTLELYRNWEIKHYAIYTISDCVDILSIEPPTVEWLD